MENEREPLSAGLQTSAAGPQQRKLPDPRDPPTGAVPERKRLRTVHTDLGHYYMTECEHNRTHPALYTCFAHPAYFGRPGEFGDVGHTAHARCGRASAGIVQASRKLSAKKPPSAEQKRK